MSLDTFNRLGGWVRTITSPRPLRPLRTVMLCLVLVGVLAPTAGGVPAGAAGLSFSSGDRLSVVFKPAHEISKAVLGETVHVLRHRLRDLGLSATVHTRNGDVVVLLADVKKARQIAEMIGETGQIFVRPALCGAPVFEKTATDVEPQGAKLPTCTASSELTVSNVGDTVQAETTFHINSVPTDQALATYPSTSPAQDAKTRTVLLPAIKGAGEFARYLLGPAALADHAFASAVARRTQLGRWVVNYTLTRKGTSQWERLARASFHKIVAVELDGIVVSAPIIEPSQSTFASFDGRGEIADRSELECKALALAMRSGELPVRLIPEATRTVPAT